MFYCICLPHIIFPRGNSAAIQPHLTSQQLNHHHSTNHATHSKLTLPRRRQHPPANEHPAHQRIQRTAGSGNDFQEKFLHISLLESTSYPAAFNSRTNSICHCASLLGSVYTTPDISPGNSTPGSLIAIKLVLPSLPKKKPSSRTTFCRARPFSVPGFSLS